MRFAALAALVALAAALRFHRLGAPSLWYDELATLDFADQPFSRLWSGWMARETNPPLYYSLVRLWIALFGNSAFAVRSLSALAGSLTPLLVYFIGRRLGLREAAWLAALVTALSTRHIVSSQEARSYVFAVDAALVAVLGLIGFDALARDGTRGEAARCFALYALGAASALYFHTTMIVLLLLANAAFSWFWLTNDRRTLEAAALWTLANLVVLALWAWWARIAVGQIGSVDISWIPRRTIPQAVSLSTGVLFPRLPHWLPAALTSLFVPVAAFGLWRCGWRTAPFLALFAVGVPLALFALSEKTPVLTQRTLLWAQFAATLALAAGVWSARRPRLSAALAGTLVALLALAVPDAQSMRVAEPWREVVARMAAELGPGDEVVFSDASIGLAIAHYCRRVACRFTPIQLDAQFTPWARGMYDGKVAPRDAAADLFRPGVKVWSLGYTEANVSPLLAAVATPVRLNEAGGLSLPDYMTLQSWTRR